MRNTIKNILLFIAISFVSVFAVGQTTIIQIKGIIKDEVGEPLIGASVSVKEGNQGTITDFDGNFSLEVPLHSTIRVSYIGFLSEEIKVTSSKALNITLREDKQLLEEVVVFGYGKIEKKDLTGSIQNLGRDELLKSMSTNVTEALSGRVSGVLVNKTSNRPGSDMNILIRGEKSFSLSSEPLYVIDGVPSYSGMRHINSADIESIDILKDASSTAIYGSRGANGVVIITTKGASKEPGFSINYDGYAGVKTATRIPDMIGNKGDGYEYVDYRIKLWKKKYGESSLGRSDFLTPDELRRIKHGEYYDWIREIADESFVTSNTISASGNSEKLSYSFGLGYLKDDGLVGNENFQRITANIGLEYKMSEKFKMGASSYISMNDIDHGADEALFNAYLLPPIVSPYGKDGKYVLDVQPTSSKLNPFLQIKNNKQQTEARYTNFSGFFEYKPLKDLSVKSQIAVQFDNSTYGEWMGTDTQSKQGVLLPEAFRRENTNQNYVWDNTITYNKLFGTDHKLDVIGLFSVQKEKHKNSQMRGKDMPYESDWHAIQTADQIVDVRSSYWEKSMLSFMGRANYIFKDRYLFTFTTRYDGTSLLASGNRWGLMPSLAFGWRISEESFMENISWVSNLKPRISWGRSGNSNLGYDITMSKLDLMRYVLGGVGQNGFGLGDNKGNKDLVWEMTSEWNLGLDFGFLNNRISGTLDVYKQETKDLITERQLASINGFTKYWDNIGKVSNRGVEIGLNTVNVVTKDFRWTTNATFTLNKNKIKSLGTGGDDLGNRWFIGHPLRVIYDFEKQGIWQESEKDEAEKFGQAPGHVKVKDLDGNYVLDERDYKILGSPSPKWTLGINNAFEYKDWDLSFYIYARYGGLYDDGFTYRFTAWDNEHWNKLDVKYWTPENKSNSYPEIGAQSYYTQVLGKVSGSFLKVQNITIGYTLPKSLQQKMLMTNARVYFSIQNPITITSYKGPDPEIIGESVSKQLSLYPMTFSLGLNLSF